MFWARRAGPLLGLLWMDAGLARSPLCFWAGGWDIWPVSLSLSALLEEKPADITYRSNEAKKLKHKAWDISNILCLSFMQMKIANNIKSTLPKSVTAKGYLKFVEERFRSVDMSLVGTLMTELATMKYDGSRSMQQHVLDMTNIATRLKTLGMIVDESFLVQFVLNSLP